jgi:hypothetical protein
MMERGLANLQVPLNVKAQLVEMLYRCGKAWFRAKAIDKAQDFVQKGYSQLRQLSGLSDKQFNDLKFMLKLLQTELEWYSNSDSAFFIANTILQECKEFLDCSQVSLSDKLSKFCKKMMEMAKETADLDDKMRWLLVAQKGLDQEKLGAFFPSLESHVLMELIKQRIESQELDLAEQLLHTLLQVSHFSQQKHNTLDAYFLMLECTIKREYDEHSLFQVLEKAYLEAKNEILTKKGLGMFVSMIQFASDKGCGAAHTLLDTIMKSAEMDARFGRDELKHHLLVTKIFLLLQKNNTESISHIKELLRESQWALDSQYMKTCLAMFWKHGDELALREEYSNAVSYYQLSCQLFSSNLADSRNHAIIQRKLAMCHLYLDDPSAARECCLTGFKDSVSDRTGFAHK